LTQHPANDIEALILETIAATSPGCGPVDASTRLLGEAAVIDSVGLVTLLVALEEKLGETVDLSAAFVERGDVEDGNPFRTVGTLTQLVDQMKSGRA
jgi:acyl carrier protein